MKIKINKFDYFGRGIARNNDKVIFVNKAIPEEIVDIKIIKENKKYDEAMITKVIHASPNRINEICPFYDKCGGCNFLHTNYEVEKEFKINKAIELFGRCDNFYETSNFNYRNKVVLHVKDGKLGLFEENSNTLVNIDYCYLLIDNINKVIRDLNKIDLSKIEKVIIKTYQNRLMVHFFGEINNIDIISYVDTLICNEKILKGNGYLEEEIDGKVFKIGCESFFQVNREGLLNIYKVIDRFLTNKKINKVLDLYSGISLWSILISDKVNEITSIEINREACINAKESIKKNNISNIKIINGNVKDYIDSFNNIDLVIIDPPRSGLDKKTREYLKMISSKFIIYISCDMHTLKRDLDNLKEVYEIKEVNLVDMFKRTYHVESVCLLCRKTVDK